MFSQLSLVSNKKLEKDPRKLPYLYPHMPLLRYVKKAEEYHRGLTIKAAEDIAKMFDAILLPSKCVHQGRRDPERRIMIYGKNYYLRNLSDLTKTEKRKYVEFVGVD